MRNAKKRKGKAFTGAVIVGFTMLYLISMVLSTWLVKRKYDEDFMRNLNVCASSIQNIIQDEARSQGWKWDELTENQTNYLKMVLSNIYSFNSADQYQMISGAIYNLYGELEVKSQNVIGETWLSDGESERRYLYYNLSDYLTDDQVKELAKYQGTLYEGEWPVPYLVYAKAEQEHWELASITIYKIGWKKEGEEGEISPDLPEQFRNYCVSAGEDGRNYRICDSEVEWKWENPAFDSGTERINMEFMGKVADFPGMQFGIRSWERWQEDEHLQNFPEKIKGQLWMAGMNSVMLNMDAEYPFVLSDIVFPLYFSDDDPAGSLVLRTTAHPWLAAMDYMKMVYLGGFLFLILCMAVVVRLMNKTYEKEKCLEEMRRDFTNAIAHELKTPLSVIRGFAENLKENTVAEKRNYYLEKIIEQTEEMDQMVGKMCDISKLDSEQLVLQKETVNVLELVKEQEKKIQELIENLNLDVEYRVRSPFVVEGDPYYLGKAFFNLLSNAAEYNRRDGMIEILVDEECISIENTGASIPEEKLKFIGNMFYSGNQSRSQSRSRQVKHHGLGLYLTRRILELHHLNLRIENVEDGVRVTVFRE